MNLERSSSWQGQTDAFLGSHDVEVCLNDYTATVVNPVRDLFAPPGSAGSNPRPVFVVINCLTNSPSHAYRELLINEIYPGGGHIDFTPSINNWRAIIDSVELPAPLLSTPVISIEGDFRFLLLGTPGRFYRIESTSDFQIWSEVATHLPGSAEGVPVTGLTVGPGSARFYRAVEE